MQIDHTAGPSLAIQADALARVGVALADENRRRIVLALLQAPAFPSDLADALSLTRGNVSNHLTCLRGCGIVRAEPEGRRVRYRIADPRLAHALAELSSLVLLVDHRGDPHTACEPDGSCCATEEPPGHVPADATPPAIAGTQADRG
ncbi:ArsR/SmtB family transcription factor [Streptomyces bohaiensis]|uniref:Winged helix-turn-helix transcriptional regulator n=1 Tax=Streptomyces bohaiensis TaxID=1431344 RepID=A0ABX1CG03_9ACTN|nr:winged helix-turn-helix transcriptional regulator [Streptomyces bohaiensis]